MTHLLELPAPERRDPARFDRELAVFLDSISRRHFIGGGAAATAVGLGVRWGSASAADADRWTFVDDRGVTISTSEVPRNVVVYEDFLPVMWERGVRPVGVLAASALADNPYIAATAERLGIDLDSVAAVSTSYGQVNMELLAALEPDLIVSYFNLLSEDAYGFTPESQPLAQELAPFAMLYIQAAVPVGAARADQLAVALGGRQPVEEDRARYEAAFARLVAVATEQSGLTIASVVANPDGVFIAGADIYPLTALLKTAGFTTIDGEPGVWSYSWEAFPTEAASDVVLLITSPADYALYNSVDDVAADFPTWSLHPAVAAGQAAAIYPNNLPPHWPSIADTVEGFADYLESVHRLD